MTFGPDAASFEEMVKGEKQEIVRAGKFDHVGAYSDSEIRESMKVQYIHLPMGPPFSTSTALNDVKKPLSYIPPLFLPHLLTESQAYRGFETVDSGSELDGESGYHSV